VQVDCVKYGRVASFVQHHRALFHLHLGYNFQYHSSKIIVRSCLHPCFISACFVLVPLSHHE
jgi:hypothetical protein